MKRLYILFLFMVMVLPIIAQAPYSLESCQQLAVQHNVTLLNAHNDINMAEEQKKEAYTKYFPTVSAMGVGFRSNKSMISAEMEGKSIDLLKKGISGSVTVMQPVFAGGQIVNNNKLAAVGIESSKIKMDKTIKDVCLNTEQYFWQVVTQKEKIETLKSMKMMLGRLYKDVAISIKAGVTLKNDLLQVQLRQNEIESQIITANNSLEVSKMLLAQYIGVDNKGFDIKQDIKRNQMPDFPLSLKQDHQMVLKTTPEYLLLEKNVESNELQRKLELGKNMPSVNVGANYSYSDLTGSGKTQGMVFASVSIPISSWWGGSHAIKRQKISVINAKNQLQDNSERILIKMQKTWNDIEGAYKQLNLAHKSIEQSNENLRLNNEYYKAGTSKMSDLLDAQVQYQQSQDKFVDAFAQYETKILEYRQLTNTK